MGRLIVDEDVIYDSTSEPNKLHSVCVANFAFYIRNHLNSGRALGRSWDYNLVSAQACPTIGHNIKFQAIKNVPIKCRVKQCFLLRVDISHNVQIMSFSVTLEKIK